MTNTEPKSREQWYQLIEAQKKSNLSQTEFCKQKGLILWRFTYHLRQYRKQNKCNSLSECPSFSPVVIPKAANTSPTEIQIDLPNGFRCQVTSPIQPEQLKNIIGVLLSC
jgi:hypothetical protein